MPGPLTTLSHKLITRVNNHGIVSPLGPYVNAAARRLEVLTSAQDGLVAFQLDTATYWIVGLAVGGGSYVWSPLTSGPEVTFAGDFAALAATYSLTVRADFDPTIGLSGATGTGWNTWTNRTGSAGSVTSGETNGIGSTTAGLNSKAGISANGASQRGIFAMPVQVAPGTVNIHKWWVGRALANAGGGYLSLFSGASGNTDFVQIGPSNVEHHQYQAGAGAVTTGVVLNQWYRGRASLTGSANDQIRIGAHAPAPTITSNTAPGSVNRGIFSDYGGGNKVSYELLRYMEIEGTLANFLLFDADAGPKAQGFWTNAIEI